MTFENPETTKRPEQPAPLVEFYVSITPEPKLTGRERLFKTIRNFFYPVPTLEGTLISNYLQLSEHEVSKTGRLDDLNLDIKRKAFEFKTYPIGDQGHLTVFDHEDESGIQHEKLFTVTATREGDRIVGRVYFKGVYPALEPYLKPGIFIPFRRVSDNEPLVVYPY